MAEVFYKFIWGGQKQLRLGIWQKFITSLLVGIWKRFITSLLVADRSSCGWGFGRGLLQVYERWKDAAEAGDLAEVYYKFISD